MGLLEKLSKEYKSVSIVGMAKNAGKTTALNYLIEEAYDEGLTLGITSTGRDGETVDLVTETEKPKVYLYEDTLVSVPSRLMELAEAGLEIIQTTPYRTSLGEIYITKVKESGYVQIAGPVVSVETKKLSEEMLSLGADLVLIDGAIDRKSVANPDSSDAVIISTGAVLSRDINKVAADTAHLVELYGLSLFNKEDIREIIEREENVDKVILVKKDGTVVKPEATSGLALGNTLNELIDENTEVLYIPGALTAGLLAKVDMPKLRNITLVVKDPTRIFIKPVPWKRLKRIGMKMEVLKSIEVCAITVNPFAPQGYSFDSGELIDVMEKAIPGIPIIDVRK